MIGLSRLFEIQSILAESGHMDAVKDIDDMIKTQKKMILIQEILTEKHSAANAMVSNIRNIIDGDENEISGFFC